MPNQKLPQNQKVRKTKKSFKKFYRPVKSILTNLPLLCSEGDRPLQMTFDDQLKILIFFHLEEHKSGRHLLQVLEEDSFAREYIAPVSGIKKSGFFDAINNRGLEQLIYLFEQLYKQAKQELPQNNPGFGELIAIDGSFVDAVLSMQWANYSEKLKKAKAHVAFDISRGVPAKVFLSDGNGVEHTYVEKMLSPGQTGVMDRGYLCYEDFDRWQNAGLHFVCRIRENSTKTVINTNEITPGSIVFYDAVVLLGAPKAIQTENQVRVVGYKVDNKEYWVATNRFDLCAEDVALIYKLRWQIETFFGWWKQHLTVYPLIARSEYGMLVQILAGMITYLLLAIYCRNEFGEKVNIKRVRQLRNDILNESRCSRSSRLFNRRC